jgi:hypothetical protein
MSKLSLTEFLIIDAIEGDRMSEVKPVYQAKMTFEGTFCEVSEDDYKRLCGSDTIQTRILYQSETVDQQKKRIEFLEYEVKHLKDALRAYGDEDIDDE